jgi:hypothetical protein
MRKCVSKVSGLAVAGLALSVLISGSAQAETTGFDMSCTAYAQMAADIATKDIMQRAAAHDTAQPGRVLMIAAGRKFYMPARQDSQAMAPTSALDSMVEWNKAFKEAKWQCLHARSITFEVKK